MKKIKSTFKILVPLIIIVVSIFMLAQWRSQYSMGTAESYELNTADVDRSLLIATQSSEFKDSLVNTIVSAFESESVYIKVIDVSDLNRVDENSWSAIVVIHTWENGAPPYEVTHFVTGPVDVSKLVVLATSSSGDNSIEEVDGISGASRWKDFNTYCDEIIERVNLILNKELIE